MSEAEEKELAVRRAIMAKVRQWLITERGNQDRLSRSTGQKYYDATLTSCINALSEDNPLLSTVEEPC